jgi:protein-disulfide isomerase-like protein with CxxC motif
VTNRYGVGSFTPKTSEAHQRWRKAVSTMNQKTAADMVDLPALVRAWREQYGEDVVRAGVLARLAMKLGLFKHTLRKSTFNAQASRLASMLEVARSQNIEVDGFRVGLGPANARIRSAWRLVPAPK